MKKIINKTHALAIRAMIALTNKKGEGFVDSGVAILISIVVGTLLLAGLYKLFGTTIIPTLTTKVTGLFSYSG
jgi:hypothetical protein